MSYTLDDAIRTAISLPNSTPCSLYGYDFDEFGEKPYKLPQWVTDELDAKGEPHDGELALRYRGLLATAARMPNWTATASTQVVLDAIGDERLRRGAEAALEHRTNQILLGPTGVGKTSTNGWAVREMGFRWLANDYIGQLQRIVDRGEDGCRFKTPADDVKQVRRMEVSATEKLVWVTAYQLAESVRQHPLGEGEPKIVADMRTKSFAVLDDLGNEPRGAEVLFSVMDSRYEQGLRTFVSTGLTMDDLTNRYGSAFVRRLTEYRGKGGVVVDLFQRAKVGAV